MILDFSGGFFLRRATAADHPALMQVCLKTGDAGRDATSIEDDQNLLGLIYAVPYQVLEPDFAFVIDSIDGIAGYLFGALDTVGFNARLAAEWYPDLRKQVVDPASDRSTWRGSDWARHAIHHPNLTIPPLLAAFPSHGHIDLLPQARGRGIGRRAMAFLEQRLGAAGSSGLFLPVNARNLDALRFYAAIGYKSVEGASVPGGDVYLVKPASKFAVA